MSSKKETPLQSVVYMLVDRRNSTFFLEDGKGSDVKAFLNTSGLQRLPNTGVRYDEKLKRLVKIRYIAGCDLIDIDEQKKGGFEPNPHADQIWFKNGQLVVSRDGTDVGLDKYMSEITYNGGAKRPQGGGASKVLFEELRQDVTAEKRIVRIDERLDAMELIRELAVRNTEGGYDYDAPKLKFLGSLFNMGELSLPEIVEALYKVAMETPDKLTASVADKTSAARVDIAQALQLDVLRIDGDVARITISEKAIHRFTAKAKDLAGRTDELVYFFLVPENAEMYRQLRVQIEYRQQQLLMQQEAAAGN